MSFNLIIPLIALALSLALMGLVLYQNHRSSSHRLFALFLLSMALWSVFAFATRNSPDSEHALLWDRLIPPAVVLASATFLHFSFVYTRIKPIRWLIPGAYLELLLIMVLSPTNLVIEGIGVDAYGYYPITGPLMYVVVLSSYSFFIVGLTNFMRRYQISTSYEERNSYLYIVAGVGCFLLGGIAELLSIFGMPIPPLALLGNILFAFLASIALLKYHLLDMRLMLRKGITYLLISVIIALPYVGIIILINRFLANSSLSTWVYLPVLLFMAVLLQPLWRWAQQLIDRLFYRERYDYLQALAHFSREAQGISDLEKLGATLVKLVSESLQSDNACLLVPASSGKNFVTTAVYQVKPAEQPLSVSLPNHSPLIQWLRNHDGFVFQRDLDINAQLQALAATERQALQKIGAELYIPIKTREQELVGVLILGPKRSRQLYSTEDKQILAPIVGQVAMSLDNARLFQEATDSYQQLKSAQDYLIQSERLRALGEISSGIAHDFNNILTSILGRAQLALDKLKDKEVKHDLEVIEQAALDAAQIVRRLQDFARVRTDHAVGSVDLNQVVKGALDIVEPRLNERRETENAFIETSLHLGEIPKARGNGAELREALVNIMINAVEAMPHGGKLSIKTKQQNGSIVVSISDTGIGMSSQVKKRVFEPFFTTKGQRGLGMGLSVVYSVIKRHGGDISVSSEPRKGATFNILLPIASESEENIMADVPLTGSGNAAIMVIDDDEGSRSVLSEMLAGAGYTVDVAASGEEGLAFMQQKSYDLVVTDLGMPGLSGRDVARAIKSGTPQTPVVLVTGWGAQINPAEEGVSGVIAKPFRKEDILIQVARLLNVQT